MKSVSVFFLFKYIREDEAILETLGKKHTTKSERRQIAKIKQEVTVYRTQKCRLYTGNEK